MSAFPKFFHPPMLVLPGHPMLLRVLEHNSLFVQSKVRVDAELLAEVLRTLALSRLAALRDEVEFLLFRWNRISMRLFLVASVCDGPLDTLGQYIDHFFVQVILLAKLSSQPYRFICGIGADINLASVLKLNLQLKQRPFDLTSLLFLLIRNELSIHPFLLHLIFPVSVPHF